MGFGITLSIVAILLAAVGLIYANYRVDVVKAREAINALETKTLETSFGQVELVDQGNGFPVLSIHGTGGGFDQGLALAAAFQAAGYRVIAPSRFGYPGASAPDRNDAVAQAEAFVEVLDQLHVERAVVAGASAGAIAALHFAALHPDRTAALITLVPAYFPPQHAAPQPWSPLRAWAIETALQWDFLFWIGLRLFPLSLLPTLLATDRELIKSADASERARLDAVITMMMPLSDRAAGLMLDARNTATPIEVDLAAITAPTFIASAEDDRYHTADSARFLAAGISNAELLITPNGGHVWVNRSKEVESATAEFIGRALSGIRAS